MRTLLLPLSLLLLACAPEVPSAEVLPAAYAPPPLELRVDPVYQGARFDVRVRGLNPGDRVALYSSEAGPGQGPCLADGITCAGLATALEVGRASAGAEGIATVRLVAPPVVGSLWFQAIRISPQPAELSDIVEAVPLPPNTDTDGDRLSDLEEQAIGTDPEVVDTDGDGLDDFEEATRSLTDPLRRDTDADLCNDAREIALGLDPHNPDGDGDTIRDGIDMRPFDVDVPDPFTIDDRLATAPATSLPDPEFDSTEGWAVWQQPDGGEVWLAWVNPRTGDLLPANGKGYLLDTLAGPMSIGRNGPEWATSDRGPQALWTRLVNEVPTIMRATRSGMSWVVEELPGTTNRATPIGSQDPRDPTPRTIWFTQGPLNPYNGWMELDDTSTSERLPDFYAFARFATGHPWVTGVHPASFADPTPQVFFFDTTTHTEAQITTSPEAKGSTFVWQAPEFGGETVFFTTHGDADGEPASIVLYREIQGAWTPVHTIEMPPGMPYVVSPEPFTWAGQSYVSFISSEAPKNVDNGIAVVWIASLDPARPLMRRISLAFGVRRKDPEFYLGGARPWVYYSVLTENGNKLRRCELGLP